MSSSNLTHLNYSNDLIFGIDKKYIINYNEYKHLLEEMICPICLKVLLEPIECKECHTIICKNCHYILKLAEIKCFNERCKGIYIKANKHIRDYLDELKIKCYACNKDELNYSDYLEHIKTCDVYLSNPVLQKLISINEQLKTIEKLEKEKERLLKKAKNKNMTSDEDLRAKYLTNELEEIDKFSFYDSVKQGYLEQYERYVLGAYGHKYNIFEDIIDGWTTFHYAMHYAKWDIIKFAIEHLKDANLIEIGFKLKTKDGKCPLLCLLQSKDIKTDVKKDIFNKIITNYNISISDEVIKELDDLGFSDLINKVQSEY